MSGGCRIVSLRHETAFEHKESPHAWPTRSLEFKVKRGRVSLVFLCAFIVSNTNEWTSFNLWQHVWGLRTLGCWNRSAFWVNQTTCFCTANACRSERKINETIAWSRGQLRSCDALCFGDAGAPKRVALTNQLAWTWVETMIWILRFVSRPWCLCYSKTTTRNTSFCPNLDKQTPVSIISWLRSSARHWIYFGTRITASLARTVPTQK